MQGVDALYIYLCTLNERKRLRICVCRILYLTISQIVLICSHARCGASKQLLPRQAAMPIGVCVSSSVPLHVISLRSFAGK